MVYLSTEKLDRLLAMQITRFGAQDATSRLYHLTVVALANIQQDEEESLSDFMERTTIFFKKKT